MAAVSEAVGIKRLLDAIAIFERIAGQHMWIADDRGGGRCSCAWQAPPSCGRPKARWEWHFTDTLAERLDATIQRERPVLSSIPAILKANRDDRHATI